MAVLRLSWLIMVLMTMMLASQASVSSDSSVKARDTSLGTETYIATFAVPAPAPLVPVVNEIHVDEVNINAEALVEFDFHNQTVTVTASTTVTTTIEATTSSDLSASATKTDLLRSTQKDSSRPENEVTAKNKHKKEETTGFCSKVVATVSQALFDVCLFLNIVLTVVFGILDIEVGSLTIKWWILLVASIYNPIACIFRLSTLICADNRPSAAKWVEFAFNVVDAIVKIVMAWMKVNAKVKSDLDKKEKDAKAAAAAAATEQLRQDQQAAQAAQQEENRRLWARLSEMESSVGELRRRTGSSQG